MSLLVTILLILSVQIPLREPPGNILTAFKQKFPSAMNIKWTEDKSMFKGREEENTWEANFILADRKTSAIFDLKGHWLITKQEIKLEDIAVKEVSSAIKKDFQGCEILSIKITNSAFYGTSYEVEGKCGDIPKTESYDY